MERGLEARGVRVGGLDTGVLLWGLPPGAVGSMALPGCAPCPRGL